MWRNGSHLLPYWYLLLTQSSLPILLLLLVVVLLVLLVLLFTVKFKSVDPVPIATADRPPPARYVYSFACFLSFSLSVRPSSHVPDTLLTIAHTCIDICMSATTTAVSSGPSCFPILKPNTGQFLVAACIQCSFKNNTVSWRGCGA